MDLPHASNHSRRLLWAAVAAFSTYFCMYAFRKPFTAGTFEGQEVFGLGLKTVLVVSQLAGYMLAKFAGIKFISEMRSEFRAIAIVGLILSAEAALVGFAFVPVPLKVGMLFLNGLPLGLVFGLVLAYLEGRQQSEALTATLCASFIVSSGVVKSVGRWLVLQGVSEFHMPMLTGLIFLPLLLLAVWILQATPPPDENDVRQRSPRNAMTRDQRRQFVRSYLPGLSLLLFVYIALTVIRTVRDDFAVEIWRDLGIGETPSVYATSETVVAIFVTALNGLGMWITHNISAIRATFGLMCVAFAVVAVSTVFQIAGAASPFVFMVACGIGLYIPYVAFHTSVFERLIAASRQPSNLGFLMYLADALGYLGYAVVLVVRTTARPDLEVLPFFRTSLMVVAVTSIMALIMALTYFHRVLPSDESPLTVEELAPTD